MDEISSLPVVTAYNRLSQYNQMAGPDALRTKTGQEFLTIFYKEMLKQAIKPPSLAYEPEDQEKNNLFSDLNTDIMVEEFAKQLVKNQLARPGWLPAEQPVQPAEEVI